MPRAVKIAGKEIRKYQDVFVIAEVASSHESDTRIAIRLLRAAAESGADAVKFQVFSARKLLVPKHPKFPSFTEIEMPPSEWQRIHKECLSVGIPFIAEIFDEESLNLMEELGVSAYKIHSTDIANPLLLEKVASTGKPLILSSGGSTFEEIEYAIGVCESKSNHNIVLMHGFQAFPTRLEDTYLSDIPRLESKFGYPVGYADHCDAETKHAFILPLVAIGMGASVIEKHITPDRSLKGRDYYSALNPDEFKYMVSLIKDVKGALGVERSGLTGAEEVYRKQMKKSIVAASRIKRDEEITLRHMAFKRTPELGVQPREYVNFVGKKAKDDIVENSLIREDDLY